MGARDYTNKADIWGAGCIFAELFRRKPILMGNTDMDQLMKVIELAGSPTDDNWPGWSQYAGIAGLQGLRFRLNSVRKVFAE